MIDLALTKNLKTLAKMTTTKKWMSNQTVFAERIGYWLGNEAILTLYE